MLLVVVMKHLYNSDERQGSSGEEEGGDIFPKCCGEWRMTFMLPRIIKVVIFIYFWHPDI